MDPTCTFCRILAEGTELVADDGDAAAFLDSSPLFPGHLLVVPRRHVVTLDEVDGDLLLALMQLVQRAVAAMPAALSAQGAFVANNNIVSQSVPHLHIHVVPRTRGDGLRGFFWPRTSYDDEAHRQDVAARLREALAS